MTRFTPNQEARPRSGFDARGFFASFLYGMGAFLGIAAILGAVMYAFLFFVVYKKF